MAEYEAEPLDDDKGTILVDYGGTYESFPILEADFYQETEGGDTALTGHGDCGYVAFFNEQGKKSSRSVILMKKTAAMCMRNPRP